MSEPKNDNNAADDSVESSALLAEVIDTLDGQLGDTCPDLTTDGGTGQRNMTDDEIREEYPLIWCFRKLNEISANVEVTRGADQKGDLKQ